MTATSLTDGDADPFASENEPTPETEQKQTELYDPRIPVQPNDRLLDLKDTLKKNGVDLVVTDFAILNQSTDVLFVLSDPANLDLIEGITIAAGGWGSGSSITSKIQLIESKKRPTLETLGASGQVVRAQISLVAPPGMNSKVTLGSL